jgi:hypothetical protein
VAHGLTVIYQYGYQYSLLEMANGWLGVWWSDPMMHDSSNNHTKGVSD